MNSLEKEVRAIEDEWVTAFERADIATLERLMSESYVLTSTNGTTLNKVQILEMLQSGELKLFSAKNSDLTVRLYGDVAIVIGLSTVKAKFGDSNISRDVRFTDVLVKRRGCWSMVAAQGSTVTAKPVAPPVSG